MMDKETCEAKIAKWKGVNKYIVKKASDRLKELGGSSPDVSLDLNGDGKVDKKDASIAAKVLRQFKKKSKSKKK